MNKKCHLFDRILTPHVLGNCIILCADFTSHPLACERGWNELQEMNS